MTCEPVHESGRGKCPRISPRSEPRPPQSRVRALPQQLLLARNSTAFRLFTQPVSRQGPPGPRPAALATVDGQPSPVEPAGGAPVVASDRIQCQNTLSQDCETATVHWPRSELIAEYVWHDVRC